jgi:3',5'-cyclic AMP phosphodiesterase CpdA
VKVFVHIVQISDLHVRPPGECAYGQVDTNAMLSAAIAAILRMDPVPDGVIASGDLTDCGLDSEYALLGEMLASLPMPVWVIPGNHDDPARLMRVLGARYPYLPREGHLHYAIDSPELRLIFLDTTLPGETHGMMCDARLSWLAEELRRGRGKPTMLVMHHPPFLTGIHGMDTLRCLNGEAMASIVRRHPEIERVVAGHYHRPIVIRWAGTVGYVAPSTAHQVALDLKPDARTRFVLEPPGLVVHRWGADTGLVSHLVPIGNFGRPFDVELPAEYAARVAH